MKGKDGWMGTFQPEAFRKGIRNVIFSRIQVGLCSMALLKAELHYMT
jgi:hypothetical protein